MISCSSQRIRMITPISLSSRYISPKERESTLEDTVASAHAQIEYKKYETLLIQKGIPADKIHKYGFAFEGKTVLIG